MIKKKKPKNLKDWEFVKDKKFMLTTLREFEDPKDFLYQFDGYLYYPAVHKIDFDMLEFKK